MSREASLYLADIEESCRLVLAYTAGMTAPQFRTDRKTVDAVVRNLEIIGEAVKHLPASDRVRRADVDWRKIAGFRDICTSDALRHPKSRNWCGYWQRHVA
ncbi:MAG TPA: HepT-like ribonuclease domain-containing protein [Geminicoccaceae bacterium]|nr:HepT-like ribonuclease domain-containing protein [Geminicoccaceae bacterium]